MIRKKFVFVALALFMGVTMLAGCLPTKQEVKEKEKSIKVGVSLTQTGGAAFIGNAYQVGLELAQEEINKQGGINGKQLELIYEDNQNTAKAGVDAFKALQLKNPEIIISTMSTSTVASSPLAEEANIPLFVSVVFADVLSTNENAISFFPRAVDDAKATVQDMVKNNVKKVGVLYLNSEYGKAGADAFVEESSQYGIEVVHTESFLGDSTDFATPYLKIKEKNPEAIYIVAVNSIPAITHIKTHSDYPEIYSNLIPVFGSLVYKKPEIFEGVHLTALPVSIKDTKEYNKFRNIVGDKIDSNKDSLGYTSVAYDNLHSIAKVLSKNEESSKFVKEFSTYGQFKGINGLYSLEGRNVGMTLYPVVFKGGQLKIVE